MKNLNDNYRILKQIRELIEKERRWDWLSCGVVIGMILMGFICWIFLLVL